jgi:hypothetical protein
MALTDLFDKWILEHGSATLSEEVIGDLRQKIADSDTTHAKAVKEMHEAQAKEITRLNELHAEEMANLERAIAALQKEQAPAKPQVGDGETAIIRIIASVGEGVSDNELTELLKLPKTTVKHHLANLESLGFADSGVATLSRGNIWFLTGSGNAYAVNNNLVGNPPPGYRPPYDGPFRG